MSRDPKGRSSGLLSLSHRACAVLGDNASARFDEFRQYRDGWDFGGGRALSSGSVAALEMFLGAYSDFPTRPSLFMTAQGNLELAWENHAGHRVEVEFFPDRFHYAIDGEAGDQKGELQLGCLPLLLTHLDLTLHRLT